MLPTRPVAECLPLSIRRTLDSFAHDSHFAALSATGTSASVTHTWFRMEGAVVVMLYLHGEVFNASLLGSRSIGKIEVVIQ